MRKEELFLRECIRSALGDARPDQVRGSVQAGFDWKYCIARARQEWVLPLVYRAFHGNDLLRELPAQVREELQTVYYATVVKNARILEVVKEINRASRAAGIPMIPVKGAFLAEHAYKDIGVRPMVDADILVHREDVLAFVKMLATFGFFPVQNVEKALAKPFSYALTCSMSQAKAQSFHIDVHWRFFSSRWLVALRRRRDVLADVWKRVEERVFDGGDPLTCLSAADTCVYTAQHAYCHGFDRLLLCADLFVLQRLYAKTLPPGSWEQEAAKYGLSSITSFSLTYMKQELSGYHHFDPRTGLMRISPCLAYGFL